MLVAEVAVCHIRIQDLQVFLEELVVVAMVDGIQGHKE
jgi:hypothetical protein